MNYDKDIPDFAMLPAKEADSEGRGSEKIGSEEFDPSPYEKLLNGELSSEVETAVIPEKLSISTEGTNKDIIWEAANMGFKLDAQSSTKTQSIGFEDLMTAPEKAEGEQSLSNAEILSILSGNAGIEPVVVQKTESGNEAMGIAQAEVEFGREDSSETAQTETEFEMEEPAEIVQTEVDFQMEEPEETEATLEAAVKANNGIQRELSIKQAVDNQAEQSCGMLVIPKEEDVITNDLKMTDIREKEEKRIFIEEDILVPDTKEDLASILSMTGTVKLHNPEIRIDKTTEGNVTIAGDVELHTLYLPERYKGEHHIIDIQSRVSFKNDWKMDASPGSRLVICPHIENITYTVVNERKFRAKIELKLCVREYANVEMQVFQGIKDEKLQLLKEKIQITHVSERKSDVIRIEEILPLKESQPKPERILKYDLNIVENHKQVSEDKAVINATVYCNILYLGEKSAGENKGIGAKNVDADGLVDESMEVMQSTAKELTPQLYQGKVEFTQFIPIHNQSEGSKITFKNNDLTLKIKEYSADMEEDAYGEEQSVQSEHYQGKQGMQQTAFILEGSIETAIELYKNLEKEIVTDVYHNKKDIVCDNVQLESMSLGGSGMTETTIREIVNVPETYGDIKRVIYICGNVKDCKNHFVQNKNHVEGIMDISLLCLPEDSNRRAFRINKEIPFKASMEIPAGKSNNKASSEVAVKELWFDKINAKQVEVNANLCIYSSVYGQEKYQVIQKVCFLENAQEKSNRPGMVVYITKEGDSLWNIAKAYRTTVGMIMEINDLEEGQPICPGQKLLIVK